MAGEVTHAECFAPFPFCRDPYLQTVALARAHLQSACHKLVSRLKNFVYG